MASAEQAPASRNVGLFFFFSLFLFLLLSLSHASRFSQEKETQLHFFLHDIVNSSSPSAIRVAQASSTDTSTTGFGAVVMMDDALTEGPDPNSKLVGRAQGIYALASQEEAGLLVAMNLAFVVGEFNGSTLAVLGRNTVFSEVREMPVVGGSGKFRLARGYALVRTHQFDLVTGNGVVEYTVHVMHH